MANKSTRSDSNPDSSDGSLTYEHPVIEIVPIETSLSNEPLCGPSSFVSSSKSIQKPGRPCVYCEKIISGGKLKRHILRKHRDVPEVQEALKMPKEKANKFFQEQKVQGIYNYNLKQLDKSSDFTKLLRERNTKKENKLLMCTVCKKFLSKNTFHRHECSQSRQTEGSRSMEPSHTPVSSLRGNALPEKIPVYTDVATETNVSQISVHKETKHSSTPVLDTNHGLLHIIKPEPVDDFTSDAVSTQEIEEQSYQAVPETIGGCTSLQMYSESEMRHSYAKDSTATAFPEFNIKTESEYNCTSVPDANVVPIQMIKTESMLENYEREIGGHTFQPSSSACSPTFEQSGSDSALLEQEDYSWSMERSSGHPSALKSNRGSKKKPGRPCVYCEKFISGGKLKRHILRKHSDIPAVKNTLKKSKDAVDKFFQQQKIQGIYNYNLKHLTNKSVADQSELLREKNSKFESKLALCSGCKKFLSKKTFYRHKAYCTATDPKKIVVHENFFDDNDFVEDILNNFTNTEVGKLCKSDKFIKQVGYRHYTSKKAEKVELEEIKNHVMTDMQELAHLFLMFKDLSSATNVMTEDMFTCEHLSTLRQAIKQLSNNSDGVDDSTSTLMKMNDVIERTVKSLKGFYAFITFQADKEAAIERFYAQFISPEDSSCDVEVTPKIVKPTSRPIPIPELWETTPIFEETASESLPTDNPTGQQSQLGSISEFKKKTGRPCIYCDKIIYGGKLKRHVLQKHKLLPEVKEVMELPKEKVDQFFHEIKIKGIYNYNLKHLNETSDFTELLQECKSKHESKLTMCSGCKMFLSTRNFYRHKAYCNSTSEPKQETVGAFDDFVEEILNHFTDTDAGNLCRTDEFIKQVGYRLYCSHKEENIKTAEEIKESVMAYMQELTCLFLTFKQLSNVDVTTEDMFTCEHLSTLRQAIYKMSDNGEHGEYKCIVEQIIKSLKAFYVETMQDEKETDIERFDSEFREMESFVNSSNCVSSPDTPVLEDESSVESVQPRNTRKNPARPCVYCDKVIFSGKLKRHILRKHKHLPEVKEALEMPREMVDKFFNHQKVEGIFKYNLKNLKSSNSAELLRERNTKYKTELRMCGGCKKFLSKKTFYKHKMSCQSFAPEPVKVDLLQNNSYNEEEFVDDMMNIYSDTKVESWLLPQQEQREQGSNVDDMDVCDDVNAADQS